MASVFQVIGGMAKSVNATVLGAVEHALEGSSPSASTKACKWCEQLETEAYNDLMQTFKARILESAHRK